MIDAAKRVLRAFTGLGLGFLSPRQAQQFSRLSKTVSHNAILRFIYPSVRIPKQTQLPQTRVIRGIELLSSRKF